MGRRLDLVARIMDNIERVPESGCWLWMRSVNWGGYGSMGVNGRSCKAHRVSYELLVGPIPEGLTLDHLCGVRCCVNPAHLEPVTRGENTLRGNAPSAQKARMKTCVRGHELTLTNSGQRRCLICKRQYSAEWFRKNAAKMSEINRAAYQRKNAAAKG